MTEEEWLADTDPVRLFAFVYHRATLAKRIAGRKYRLTVCAIVRFTLPYLRNPDLLKPVELAERYVDGGCRLTDVDVSVIKSGARHYNTLELLGCLVETDPHDSVYYKVIYIADREFRDSSEAVRLTTEAEHRAGQVKVLRDIFGNPFRPVTFDPSWRTSTAVGLAQSIYDSRAFDRMPILADALEEAGCDEPSVLTHCRGDGPHVRGCWVVDLILGKS